MLHRFASHATWGVVGVLMLLLIALPFAGCGSSSAPAAPPDEGPDDGIPPNMNPDTAELMLALWETSGHADFEADAFRHWDEDGVVEMPCARCHSTGGYQDYIGLDGTPFELNAAAPLGTTVNCNACHNAAADALTEVHFPSGAIATGLGAEARCMQCHQGRESTVSMNTHIALASVNTDATQDDAAPGLSFRNIHYFAAGATLYGGNARGAYQYTTEGSDGVIGTDDDGERYGFYDKRNPHVKSMDTCIECHNPHSLEREIDRCADCHVDRNDNPVSSDAALRDIRMAGSVRDYDADGDATEGIFYEIETLTEKLYAAIQMYATNVLTPIIYDGHSYPYFFKDTNGNGQVDAGEANFGNRYTGWSARLLRAAYNYQYSQKDPGAFAHNPKYTIEFLYDSLKNLDDHPQVTVPMMDEMWRNDSGHFDAGARAFRRWDNPDDPDGVIDNGTVSTSCARCHSPGGFDFWAEWGLDVTQPQDVGDGFRCEQCHVEDADFGGTPAVKYVDFVEFPSGEVVDNDPGDPDTSFLCFSCHKGRESGVSVEADIQARLNDGNPATNPRFRNIHYLPAGAMLYGDKGKVGYQYPAKIYAPKWNHFQSFGDPGGNSPGSQCVFCHLEDHTFLPQIRSGPYDCTACHQGATLRDFRINRATDYNGNGNTDEQLKDEIAGLAARLWTALVDYEANTLGGTLTLLPGYPYYSATTWDAKLARAIFNYQFWSVEHGAWAHNTNYIAQLLYDSIEDLGGNLDFLEVPGRPLIIPPP